VSRVRPCPRYIAVVVPYVKETWRVCGTTTMRLGETRQGPLAPEAFQRGKYETLTSMGTPILSTEKLIFDSDVVTFDTVTLG
jgi:hypothetical protein